MFIYCGFSPVYDIGVAIPVLVSLSDGGCEVLFDDEFLHGAVDIDEVDALGQIAYVDSGGAVVYFPQTEFTACDIGKGHLCRVVGFDGYR